MGYRGSEEQYRTIQKQYLQISNMASKCYDNVIIDIDKKLDMKTRFELTNAADVVIAMTTQKLENIRDLITTMNDGVALKKQNSIITLGKYDEK